MSLFNRRQRTFVLGLDGFPYSLLKRLFEEGLLPNIKEVVESGSFKRMNSVYPTVSSVAWASYSTGLDPSGHNIFGFIDRISNPFSLKISTARDKKGKTLWKELSEQKKKVIVINVPSTYPPEEVNGILISGFLCPDIENCVYPKNISGYLKSKGYIIDVDAWLIKESREKFIKVLLEAMDKRFEVAFDLMKKEQWDFFQLHIMETDRLFHFLWDDIEEGIEKFKDIMLFFEKLDNHVKVLKERLSGKDRFLVLSDHGFCRIKKEIQLNTWLEKEGFLKFEDGGKSKLADYSKDSVCYSLLPGRIFINLKGREEKGSVESNTYNKTRNFIKERLLKLKDQEGQLVIEKVFFREEIYKGNYIENAADIIAHPARGYDLKGELNTSDIFTLSNRSGMHTYDDAFISGINIDINCVSSIQDVKNIIVNRKNSKRKLSDADSLTGGQSDLVERRLKELGYMD